MQLKKSIFILFSIIIIIWISVLPVLASEEQGNKPIYLGDVNGENNITVSDAILVLREIVGLSNLKEYYLESWQRGDVNLDGTLAVNDAIMILRKIVGLSETFDPVESPVVYTEKALKFVIEETDRNNINIARDLEISEDILHINRDLTLNGKNNPDKASNYALRGTVIIGEEVLNFTARNLEISVLILNEGGNESVKLENVFISDLIINAEVAIIIDVESEIARAFFYNSASVSGGNKIINVYISSQAEVDFGTENERPLYEASGLNIIEAPKGTSTGEEIFPAPAVQVTDKSGNSLALWGIEITVSLDKGEFSAGSLTALTSSEGIAVFPGLTLDTPGNYTLLFEADNLEPIQSAEINITDPDISDPDITDPEIPSAATEAELRTLIEDETVSEINITANIVLAKPLEITRNKTLRGSAENKNYAVRGNDIIVSEVENFSLHNIETDTLIFNGNDNAVITIDNTTVVELLRVHAEINITITNNSQINSAYFFSRAVVTGASKIKNAWISGNVDARDIWSTEDQPETFTTGINTFFTVNPDKNIIVGWNWTEESPVDVAVYGGSGIEIYREIILSSEEGVIYLLFNDYNFNIEEGNTVIIGDGRNRKVHKVRQLAINTIDEDKDTISGAAEPGSMVGVIVETDNGYSERNVIADEKGLWKADFSQVGNSEFQQIINLEPGRQGFAEQKDEGANSTRIHWRLHNPYLVANLTDNSITAFDWPPDSEIVVEIDGEAIEGVSIGNSEQLKLSSFGVTLIPGSMVTLCDGIFVKTHEVRAIEIVGINSFNNTISGKTDRDGVLSVYLYTPEGLTSLTVKAEAETDWTAIFSENNIAPENHGYILQKDSEGNYTRIDWQAPAPVININLTNNNIEGQNWPVNKNVIVSIDGEKTERLITDEFGYFIFHPDGLDLNPGQIITAIDSDGIYSKEHEIIDLEVSVVNFNDSTISGTSNKEGTGIVSALTDLTLSNAADVTDGMWTVTFTEKSIQPGNIGLVTQKDGEGDTTTVGWRALEPSFMVCLTNNTVSLYDWPMDKEVNVTITEVEGEISREVFIASYTYEKWGQILSIDDFIIEPGHEITITAGDDIHLKTHTVKNIQVLEANPETDTIYGITGTDGLIKVQIVLSHETFTEETFPDNGEWSAQFTEGIIVPGTDFIVTQFDNDGDQTSINWRLYDPVIIVNLTNNIINGSDWPKVSQLTLTIKTDEGDENILEEILQVDGENFFYFNPGDKGLHLETGYLIFVITDDGYYKKTIKVADIQVILVNPAENILSGFAEADSTIRITVFDDDDTYILTEETDHNGEWTLFSALIRQGISGTIHQSDLHNNETVIRWRAKKPSLTANITHNTILGNDWPANEQIEINLINYSDQPYNFTAETTDNGDFIISPGKKRVTLKAGDLITAADSSGMYEASHKVFDLEINEVDAETKAISGKTDSEGTIIHLSIYGEEDYFFETTADSEGNWTAGFPEGSDIKQGSKGFVKKTDNQGNSTKLEWEIPNPSFIVGRNNEAFYYIVGRNWNANSIITVTINGDESILHGETGEDGIFRIDNLLLEPGYEIGVSDGLDTRSHIVKSIIITSVNMETGIIQGTAVPHMEVSLSVNSGDFVFSRYVTADDEGKWAGDLSAEGLSANDEIKARVYDEYENATAFHWLPAYIWVFPADSKNFTNTILGVNFPPSHPVNLSINNEDFTDEDTVTDQYGTFMQSIPAEEHEIKAGDEIRVVVAEAEITYTVAILIISDVSRTDHYAEGSAAGNTRIIVLLARMPDDELLADYETSAETDLNDNWFVDFAADGKTIDEENFIMALDVDGSFFIFRNATVFIHP